MTEPQPVRSTPCESENQNTFPAEMIIHFPGFEGLDKPHLPVSFDSFL
jgi:hypothetical protein